MRFGPVGRTPYWSRYTGFKKKKNKTNKKPQLRNSAVNPSCIKQKSRHGAKKKCANLAICHWDLLTILYSSIYYINIVNSFFSLHRADKCATWYRVGL